MVHCSTSSQQHFELRCRYVHHIMVRLFKGDSMGGTVQATAGFQDSDFFQKAFKWYWDAFWVYFAAFQDSNINLFPPMAQCNLLCCILLCSRCWMFNNLKCCSGLHNDSMLLFLLIYLLTFVLCRLQEDEEKEAISQKGKEAQKIQGIITRLSEHVYLKLHNSRDHCDWW